MHYEDCQVPALVGPPVETGACFLAAHYAGKREVSWCACVTRVRDLLEVGPQPDDCIIGDMFYWTKLAQRGPVGCIPSVLSHYVLLRSQNDNMSHGTPPAVWASESRRLADEVIEMLRRAGADRDYLSRLEADCRSHIGCRRLISSSGPAFGVRVGRKRGIGSEAALPIYPGMQPC